MLIFARRRPQRLDESDSSAIAAAISPVLTHVWMFGQALGVQREFSGLMSKPWRMVALHPAAWLTFACRSNGNGTTIVMPQASLFSIGLALSLWLVVCKQFLCG